MAHVSHGATMYVLQRCGIQISVPAPRKLRHDAESLLEYRREKVDTCLTRLIVLHVPNSWIVYLLSQVYVGGARLSVRLGGGGMVAVPRAYEECELIG